MASCGRFLGYASAGAMVLREVDVVIHVEESGRVNEDEMR